MCWRGCKNLEASDIHQFLVWFISWKSIPGNVNLLIFQYLDGLDVTRRGQHQQQRPVGPEVPD